MRRIKPKLEHYAILIAIILATLVFFIVARPQLSNGILVKNLTDKDIVITGMAIDKSIITTNKVVIRPELLEKQLEVYVKTKKTRAKFLEVFIKGSDGQSSILSCKIDFKKEHCLIMGYIKNNHLNCICDSYDDFED